MKLIRPFPIIDTTLVSSSVAEPEASAPLWSNLTTYAAGDYVSVISTNSHKMYQSLQAGNLNKDPTNAANSAWWVYVSPTARWRMFDPSISTKSRTSGVDTLAVTLQFNDLIDSVVLLGVSGNSVRIIQTVPVDGVVYDKTYSMVSDAGIADWYAHLTEPLTYLADIAITDLVPAINSTLRIVIFYPGDTARCGACIPGQNREYGLTKYGLSMGITDFSVKAQDTFGNFIITPRAYSKWTKMQLWVDRYMVDELQRTLAAYRSTPVVSVGADAYSASIVYGFFKSLETVIDYPTTSLVSIEWEGLT